MPRLAAPTAPGLEVDKLFRSLVKLEGSDLHLKVGLPPHVRVAGALRPLNRGPIDAEEMTRLVPPLLSERTQRIFDADGGVDFAYTIDIDGAACRFRVNVFQQMGKLGLVARRVNNRVPDFAALHLPASLEEFCKFAQGMVLISGITGSGKSTTAAAMIDWINHRNRKHVLTLEDPIEFTYQEDKCLVNQRELGEDVRDFTVGLKHAVREDPDVILVGEMRDRDTFEAALRAAETGHLVFGTIHASSAASTVTRILDLFPQGLHEGIRNSLAFNMRAIVSQKLLPSILEKTPLVPAVEILAFTPTVRKLILEGQDDRLADAIRIGKDEGMIDFTTSLKELVDKELVARAAALEAAPNAEALRMALKGIQVRESGIL